MVYFLCKAYDSDRQNCYFARSLPVRGAWIEIELVATMSTSGEGSLPVRGAWIEIGRVYATHAPQLSLPVRGAWIEIAFWRFVSTAFASLPVRGAWIEISVRASGVGTSCRSPCGERGLKSLWSHLLFPPPPRRSPCGERGLKWFMNRVLVNAFASLPVRGAWIEICSESV